MSSMDDDRFGMKARQEREQRERERIAHELADAAAGILGDKGEARIIDASNPREAATVAVAMLIRLLGEGDAAIGGALLGEAVADLVRTGGSGIAQKAVTSMIIGAAVGIRVHPDYSPPDGEDVTPVMLAEQLVENLRAAEDTGLFDTLVEDYRRVVPDPVLEDLEAAFAMPAFEEPADGSADSESEV